MRTLGMMFCLVVSLSCIGCASWGNVPAWERGHLAKRQMSLDVDPADARFIQHIYTSKESASGGYGVGGGGCGCN
jgi:Domain of unknown function (DUF4266)